MASGGKKETPTKGFDWPEEDLQFMIEQLVATGRFEVLPTSISTSLTQNLGARPKVKTPSTPKVEATTDTSDLVSLPSQLPLATSTPDHKSVKAEPVQSEFKLPLPNKVTQRKLCPKTLLLPQYLILKQNLPPPMFILQTLVQQTIKLKINQAVIS